MTPTAGKLELLPDAVRLTTPDGDGPPIEVPYGELSAVWLEEATLLLTAAAAWRDCVAGLARVAEEAYSWESPRAAQGEGIGPGEA